MYCAWGECPTCPTFVTALCRLKNHLVTKLVNDGGTTEGRDWFSAFTGDWYCKGVGVNVAIGDVCGLATSIERGRWWWWLLLLLLLLL
jgi:hypothetical protein